MCLHSPRPRPPRHETFSICFCVRVPPVLVVAAVTRRCVGVVVPTLRADPQSAVHSRGFGRRTCGSFKDNFFCGDMTALLPDDKSMFMHDENGMPNKYFSDGHDQSDPLDHHPEYGIQKSVHDMFEVYAYAL